MMSLALFKQERHKKRVISGKLEKKGKNNEELLYYNSVYRTWERNINK